MQVQVAVKVVNLAVFINMPMNLAYHTKHATIIKREMEVRGIINSNFNS